MQVFESIKLVNFWKEKHYLIILLTAFGSY